MRSEGRRASHARTASPVRASVVMKRDDKGVAVVTDIAGAGPRGSNSGNSSIDGSPDCDSTGCCQFADGRSASAGMRRSLIPKIPCEWASSSESAHGDFQCGPQGRSRFETPRDRARSVAVIDLLLILSRYRTSRLGLHEYRREVGLRLSYAVFSPPVQVRSPDTYGSSILATGSAKPGSPKIT